MLGEVSHLLAGGEHLNWVLENPGLSTFVITSEGSPTEICGHSVGRVLQGPVDLDAKTLGHSRA